MSKHFEIEHFESRCEPGTPRARLGPESPAIDHRAMTPTQWRGVTEAALHRARQARAEAIRDGWRWLGSGLSGFATRLAGRIAAGAAHERRAIQVARERHRAVMQLSRFNDRELKDIGLRRGDIRAAVYGRDPTWRR